MITKKCVLTILSPSCNYEGIRLYINDFISPIYKNYKYTATDFTKEEAGVLIFVFATTFDATFIKERLVDMNFPYCFTVINMENDDNFDYSFGDTIIDDIESINVDFALRRPLLNTSGLSSAENIHIKPTEYISSSTYPNIKEVKIEFDDFIKKVDLKAKKHKERNDYTLDELIDIISEIGYDNLTETQKECLKKYN